MANTVEKGLVSKSALTAIGDAIRAKSGSTTKYKPSEMAQAIKDIERDKYTLKVINPKNATITSSLVAKTINNSDGTVSAVLTDKSTYIPYTGYQPGIILRSIDEDTGVYTVTGSAASPSSIIDSRGFARMYGKFDSSQILLYPSDSYSGTYTELDNATGKIFIAGLKKPDFSEDYVYFSKTIYAFFDPYNIDAYGGISSGPNSCALAYFSVPNCTVDRFYFGYWGDEKYENLKYADFGYIARFQELHFNNSVLQTMILRNTNSKVSISLDYMSGCKITNLYVPSSLLPTYKADSEWSKCVVKFVALEGSKYEDPYAFLDEIPT